MRSIHIIYVVVALLSPHYAWTPTTALVSSSQLWKSKNKLRLPSVSFSRWLQASSSWHLALASPISSSDDEEDIVRRRCAADILSLMGGADQRNTVAASRAQELLSCVRFLVPPREERKEQSRKLLSKASQRTTHRRREEDLKRQRSTKPVNLYSKEQIFKLVREPPPAVAELARRSVVWAGEPEALLTELDSTLYKIPDVEGSSDNNCVLTKHDFGKRFAQEEINSYLAFLFEAIVELAPSAGLNVSLNRFDLFHGHMFTSHDSGRLGILFHSREYPEFDKVKFPINLGYCQAGSYVPYDDSMDLRNIVWLAPMPSCSTHGCSEGWLAPGALFILDARPDGIVFKELVSEWVDVVRTVYESDMGRTVLDVNYFKAGDESDYQIFFM